MTNDDVVMTQGAKGQTTGTPSENLIFITTIPEHSRRLLYRRFYAAMLYAAQPFVLAINAFFCAVAPSCQQS